MVSEMRKCVFAHLNGSFRFAEKPRKPVPVSKLPVRSVVSNLADGRLLGCLEFPHREYPDT